MFFKLIEGSCWTVPENNVKSKRSILVKDFALLWEVLFFKRVFGPDTERPSYLNFILIRVRGDKKEKRKKKKKQRVKKKQ